MHEIHLIFIKKEDANKSNELFCKFFQGSKLFINNYIMVTPVKLEHQIVKKGKVDRWAFNICFFDDIDDILDTDENIVKSTVISAGELNIMNRKTVWAFDILDPEKYVTSTSKSEK